MVSPSHERRGYFFYLRNMPRWGFEGRRRLRAGTIVKGAPRPPADESEPFGEQLIWIAARHPVVFWAVAASGILPIAMVLTFVGAVLLLR
jgi:hypothetical protein